MELKFLTQVRTTPLWTKFVRHQVIEGNSQGLFEKKLSPRSQLGSQPARAGRLEKMKFFRKVPDCSQIGQKYSLLNVV